MNLRAGKKPKRLGFVAGFIMRMLGKPKKKSDRQIAKEEFKTSTARMGLTFTEKIRNTFRFRWLKKSKLTPALPDILPFFLLTLRTHAKDVQPVSLLHISVFFYHLIL